MNDSLRHLKAEIFHALAHPTRIAIVEILQEEEMSAGSLVEKLHLGQANASQHLSILRAKGIVLHRKVGNQIFYSLRDKVLVEILDALRRYLHSQLSGTMIMMKEITHEKAATRRRPK